MLLSTVGAASPQEVIAERRVRIKTPLMDDDLIALMR
jgi:hypothetical protein